MKVILLAGGGNLPKIVASYFLNKKIPFYCLGFTNNHFNINLKKYNYKIINFGKIISEIKNLKSKGYSNILMVGSLSRPNLMDIRPDFNAIKIFPKVAKKIIHGGDNHLLSFAISYLEDIGFNVLSIKELIPNLLFPKGNLTKNILAKETIEDVNKAKKILDSNSKFDIGQSVIIQQGTIIGIEAIEGTDKLIKRSKQFVNTNITTPAILVKLAKRKQELRVDLPTIGLQTVKNCLKNNIYGIAFSANTTIFLDKKQILDLCFKNKFILYGI